MIRQEVRQEESNVENKFSSRVTCVGVGSRNVCAGRNHAVDRRHDHSKENDEFRVVFGTNIKGSNLCQTFECNVTEDWGFQELPDAS